MKAFEPSAFFGRKGDGSTVNRGESHGNAVGTFSCHGRGAFDVPPGQSTAPAGRYGLLGGGHFDRAVSSGLVGHSGVWVRLHGRVGNAGRDLGRGARLHRLPDGATSSAWKTCGRSAQSARSSPLFRRSRPRCSSTLRCSRSRLRWGRMCSRRPPPSVLAPSPRPRRLLQRSWSLSNTRPAARLPNCCCPSSHWTTASAWWCSPFPSASPAPCCTAPSASFRCWSSRCLRSCFPLRWALLWACSSIGWKSSSTPTASGFPSRFCSCSWRLGFPHCSSACSA